MALSVVTFNIGGGVGTRYEKKEMLNKFFNNNLPSLLYLQENPWRKQNIGNHVQTIEEKYEAVSHEHFDATVLYRTDVLNDEGHEEVLEFFQDALENKSHLDFEAFQIRASFSKLIEIKTGKSFVAIAWHGVSTKEKAEKKKDIFKDLLLVIKDIHSNTSLPVVLGGDFNISLDSVSDFIEGQDLEVYAYDLANRKSVIDFFVVTPDVQLSNVRAFRDYMYVTIDSEEDDSEEDDSEEEKKVFDHDPVQALVSFDLEDTSEDTSQGTLDDVDSLDDLAHVFNEQL